MNESNEQREERARDLAFKQGKREAEVDAVLKSHEVRLGAINGSIEKHARNAAAMRDSMEALGDKLDQVAATLATNAAVEMDRVAQLRRANEKQISTRMFVIGVLAIIATIIAAFISQGHLG